MGQEFVKTPASEHGHIHPRPDGTKADCGGPRHCRACRDELVAMFEAGQHATATLANQYVDPHHVLTDLLEAMKGQLLIVLTNRLGGRVDIPVSEVDATGQWMLAMEANPTTGVFTFRTERKS